MNRNKKRVFQMKGLLVGVLFLITFFTNAQGDKGSISKESITYGFSNPDFKSDGKYVAAKPEFNIKNYLTESLGDFYPEGNKEKDLLRVNVLMDVTQSGEVNNIIYHVHDEDWQPSELEKIKQVIAGMSGWSPSKKKGKAIDSKIILSFTMLTSYSISENYLAVLGESSLEIYDRLPDEEMVEKEVKIIIEANGQVHFNPEFQQTLSANHPQETQDILNKTIQNLPKEAKGSNGGSKEHLVTLAFKKVRDPSVSQERLDSIKMLMSSGDKYFKDVDKEASFPEGEEALITYLKKGTGNAKKLVLTRYASAGKKVYVGVTYGVTKEGKISSARITKGKEKLSASGKEKIIELFENMPEWSPARKLDVAVNKRYFQKVVLSMK